MLLDPPEEELDLPALLVQQGDAFRGKGKIVGEEDQVLSRFRVDIPDATQFVGVMLRRVDPREDDGLIGPHPGRFVDGSGIQPAVAQILLGPDDEEGRAVREGMKPFEVQIPPVHHVVRSRLGDQFVQDIDVVPLPVGDLDERGDVPPQIQQGVEFDGRLPFPEPCPGKQGETQVDRRGVRSIVVELRAYTVCSNSTANGSFAYSALAVRMSTCAKSAKIRQSRFSLAFARVVREIPPRMPMW